MRKLRKLKVAGAVIVGLAVIGLIIVQLRLTTPSRASAQEVLMVRQNQELLKLTAAAEKGALLDFKGMLIVVDQALVQDLLRQVTPLDADVGNGFHVRIESADTVFGDGVALVRLTGTATVNKSSVGAEVTVMGAIDVVQIDPTTGVLQCRVTILGVDAKNIEALGRGDPIGRLTEALAHGGLSMLLGVLEIPVSIEDRFSIPEVSSKRLRIEAADLPLTVAAQQVRVFGGRLWIFVDVALTPASPGPKAPPLAPTKVES